MLQQRAHPYIAAERDGVNGWCEHILRLLYAKEKDSETAGVRWRKSKDVSLALSRPDACMAHVHVCWANTKGGM